MSFDAYRRIFAIVAFRRFWIGFTISVFGDALTSVAFTWYVFQQTRSAEALGILMLCYTGPIVVGGLVAGWLLDRFERRVVIICDNLIRGMAMAAIPLLYALGLLEVWHIYAAAGVFGLLMMISLAGGPSLVPSLVPEEQLATANALEMIAYTLGGVVGPIIAGLLIGWIGAPYVVAFDALSYMLFALFLLGIPAEAKLGHTARPGGHSVLAAVRLLVGQPVLLSITIMFLVFNIGGGVMSVWLPILVDQLPRGGATLFGIMLGVQATGEIVSSLLAGGLTLRLTLGSRICIAQFLAGMGILIVMVARDPWTIGLGMFIYGFCSAPLTIWAQTLRMRIIPAELRGRTFALLRMLMQSGRPLGGALAGAFLPVLGITTAIGASAFLTGIPGIAGLGVKELSKAGQEAEAG